jgi:hypothetical protein
MALLSMAGFAGAGARGGVSARTSARIGGPAKAHQKTPRVANRPMAKKIPSDTREGHGVGLVRRARIAAAARTDTKKAAPEMSRTVGGCHSVMNRVMIELLEMDRA